VVSSSDKIVEKFISLVIPNYNGSATIGKCLEAAFASHYGNFEIIVVDDCSTDDSVDIVTLYPCKLIRMKNHSGAAGARNAGAASSSGALLFFIDADCLIKADALARANQAAAENANTVIGGTYTQQPYDADFFSIFQSFFIHYFETKKQEPDYIATHAMIINADLFRSSGGFREGFFPIIEDVEFCHRLRRSGCRLLMQPEILVTHVFNFTLMKSLRNGFRKSMYWTMYSLMNRDLFADSGTASVELKANVAAFYLNAFCVTISLYCGNAVYLVPVPFVCAADIFFSRGLIASFYRVKGFSFTIAATLYYTAVYPLSIGSGALLGSLKHFLIHGKKRVTISS